jgi:hypothetical protein
MLHASACRRRRTAPANGPKDVPADVRRCRCCTCLLPCSPRVRVLCSRERLHDRAVGLEPPRTGRVLNVVTPSVVPGACELAHAVLHRWVVNLTTFLVLPTTSSVLPGYGGAIEALLSARFWEPYARLTFGAYLLHPIIMQSLYLSQTTLLRYSPAQVLVWFIAHVVLSFAGAALLYVLIEAPTANVERAVLASAASPRVSEAVKGASTDQRREATGAPESTASVASEVLDRADVSLKLILEPGRHSLN